MLSREQCRALQKCGESVAERTLADAHASGDKAAVEFAAYGMVDFTGRVLAAYVGPEFTRQFFLDMADRIVRPPPSRPLPPSRPGTHEQ